ncbi:hypothetical protein [Rufibacter immobilis]|uniref:hypothetical protein n=1 Tax=Rufibacter immobilis TaxID=1348778 RepID=UPI00161948C2|nr:hypothetical protein [Rufibacter immobilis]
MNILKDLECDFCRIIMVEQHQVLLFRKKNTIVAMSRMHIKGKHYATYTVEREY